MKAQSRALSWHCHAVGVITGFFFFYPIKNHADVTIHALFFGPGLGGIG
jgi:hypothetical protein